MRILLATAATLLATGCAGDSTDTGKGQVCMGALYDDCGSEHDCMTNDCQTYAPEGFNVCTQACTATTPCPDQNGMPVTCDTARGECKPAGHNDCRVLP
jgi:hypothetical protein